MDFETANRMGGVSACQVALVKVEDGHITDRYTTFLRPPAGYDHFEFTYLHGISALDVVGAPTWAQVADQVAQFVDGAAVYAHNASFDRGVWRRLDEYFNIATLPPSFYCSYRTARSLRPGLVNYKLPTVAAEFAPEYRLNHHRADSDAEACALIVCGLQNLVRELGR